MKPEHIDMIKNQLDEIENLFNLNCENPKFKKWHKKTEMILEEILGKNDDKIKEFKDIDFFAMINMMPGEVFPTQMDIDAYGQDLEEAKLILETIIERYEMFEKDKQLMNCFIKKIKQWKDFPVNRNKSGNWTVEFSFNF